MKITTNNLGEVIAVIQIRYNFSLKELSKVWNIHPRTLSAKKRTNKFNTGEVITITDWIKDNGYC